MKGRVLLLLLCVGFLVALFGGQAMASRASLMYGEVLFADPGLAGSPNKLSCASCHADGKGFDLNTDLVTLAEKINHCATTAMQGASIKEPSIDMTSLQIYILSLIHY